jgi:hypothetical protein
MGLRTQLIKCSNCGRNLEDTGQDEFTCHFCGKKTIRDLSADQEVFEQKVMVMRLNAEVKWQKSAYKILMACGIGIIALSFIFHFADKFLPLVMYSTVAILVMGIVVLFFGLSLRKKYKGNSGKLMDLTGGRGFITLK